MLNADEIHFVSAKKKSRFRIKTKILPFICNSRSKSEEVDKILKEMNFSLSFTWSYDPLGIISKLRVENKTTPYVRILYFTVSQGDYVLLLCKFFILYIDVNIQNLFQRNNQRKQRQQRIC